jgi:acyl-CoA synthetase (AMP-forming)/AMP-acid ligase II
MMMSVRMGARSCIEKTNWAFDFCYCERLVRFSWIVCGDWLRFWWMTSRPKIVPLTHANLVAAATAIGAAYAIGPGDLCFNPMPHYHVHGLISAGLSSLLAGAAQYCATSFSAQAFDQAFGALRPTWFTGSPAFHLGLRDHYKFAGSAPPRGRLRFMRSSSAPFPASMIDAYEALFGVPLLENYGMTETASTICTNPLPPRPRKPGSVGVPIGSDIRIVDANRNDVAAGEAGQIVVKGPSTITRYAGDGAGSFLDQWLCTGDIGRIDGDGYLFVLGRTKELIKRGGHSVYPLEVDNAMLAYPAVAEAISFAIPHPTLGEELVAVVVPRLGMTVEPEAFRDFLEAWLEQHQPDWKQSADKVARENNKLERADRYGQPESALSTYKVPIRCGRSVSAT